LCDNDGIDENENRRHATVSLFSVFGVLKKINKNQTGRPAGGRAKSLARIIVRRRVVIIRSHAAMVKESLSRAKDASILS
jgi:hypothetical protein